MAFWVFQVIGVAILALPLLFIGACVRRGIRDARYDRWLASLPPEQREAELTAANARYHRMVEETYPLRAMTHGWKPFDRG